MLMTHGASAEVFEKSIGLAVVEVGGFCDGPVDERLDAPKASGGKIDHNFHGNVYVVHGDRIQAQNGLGVGLRVWMAGVGTGDSIVERIRYPDGHVSQWDVVVGGTGQVEFGTLPLPGRALTVGPYYFSVLQDGKFLFTYRIVVEGTSEDDLCVPEVS